MEFQIRKRKRSKLPHYFVPRNPKPSPICEIEQAAQILIMISRDTSFLTTKPSNSPQSKQESFPKSKPESSPKSKPTSVSREEPSLKTPPVRSALHECTTCGKTFPSHQALGGHKTMHNRPSLKRKRSEKTEAPLINGAVPVLDNPSTSEAPFVPVVHAAVPVPQKPRTLKTSNSQAPLVPVVHVTVPVSVLDRSESEARLVPVFHTAVPVPVPVRQKPTATKTHVCKECGKTFLTGQALGGHMREHFKGVISHQKKKADQLSHEKTKKIKRERSETESVAELEAPIVPVAPVPVQERKVKFEFDLNFPPEMQKDRERDNNEGEGPAGAG